MKRTSFPSLGKVGCLTLLPCALMVIPTSWLERRRSLCLFRRLTGRPCPGCGMTRAFSRAFHGDIRGALHYNKRIIITLPILAYAWVRALIKEISALVPAQPS